MKKMTLVAILTGVFVLAMVASAFALGPAYQSWTDPAVVAANAGAGSPHQNYRLTTVKCAVCHSVHGAATATNVTPNYWSNYAITGPTQLLLRGSAASACNYCHIETQIGVFQIYGGNVSYYNTNDAFGHNEPAFVSCTSCHSVHGANAFSGGVSSIILRKQTAGGSIGNGANQVQAELNTAYVPSQISNIFTGVGNNQAQISGFCSQCHKAFSPASEQTITASGYFTGNGLTTFAGPVDYKNHPMKSFDLTLTADGVSAGVGQAAWVDSTYCRSCHAAGYDFDNAPAGVLYSTFPHYTPARANFLTAGYGSADASATKGTSVTNMLGAGDNGHSVLDQGIDSVCLRCHTNGSNANASGNSNGSAGVGITF